MVCCAHHDFNLFFFMLQQAVDKRGSSQCLKIHRKSLTLQQTTKRATFNFKSFFARKFKYFEKIVKICLHSSFHFDDFLRYFSNTMTIVTFIKEDLISDSWRNKESSCQNRFCCLMNIPLASSSLLSHLCHSFKKNLKA